MNEYISSTLISDGSVVMNSIFCMPEFYLVEESSPTSAGNLTWLAKNILDTDKAEAARMGKSIYIYKVFDQMAEKVNPNTDLYYLPYIFGSQDHPPKCIRLAGGAAHSQLWVQMFADVLGYPVETVVCDELGTLGCAINGAVACGFYKNLKEAVDSMVCVNKQVEPNPQLFAVYERKYGIFKQLVQSLMQVWDQFQY